MANPDLTPDQTAALILDELLALRPQETVAIVCDEDSPAEMLDALRAALRTRGNETAILTQANRPPEQKNLLNPAIAKGLEAADVLIALTMTGGAPIYAAEVKALLDAKRLRMMSMVMRGMEIFTRGGATADYAAVYRDCEALRDIWRQGGVMRITSDAGTDISAPVATDRVIIECGYATEPGTSAAFSDGEVSSRPAAGAANGVFVIDGPGAVIGLPEAPISVTVRDGKVIDIAGECPQVDQLRAIVAGVANADHIAEFGLGMNPACLREGQFEEEKKGRGQVHIAIGDDIFYGGSTRSVVHMDLVLRDPTVTLGDRVIIDRGRVTLG